MANDPTSEPGFSLLIGLLAGSSLAATAAILLWPAPEPDVERYRAVRDYARREFVRPVDQNRLLDHALQGMAEGLDGYSTWYDRDAVLLLDRETAGRYRGLGVSMRLPLSDGRVLFPLAGSPAERAGLRPGDRIMRVDEREFSALPEGEFHRIVSTEEPKEIALEVVGLDGTTRHLLVRTDSVVEPTVRREELVDLERGVAYVAIVAFSHETGAEFDAALERLRARGMRALIVDLRGDPGGVLTAAVDVARRFVRDGIIVTTEGRGDDTPHQAVRSEARWAGLPLALLVDQGTASAAEVLSGALQDHRAAVLVGTSTYGKGMVQTIHRFSDGGGALKITTSFYYTPAHRNLERGGEVDAPRGLQPDLWVSIPAEARRALHEYLAKASPPPRWHDALAEWERAEHVVLVDPRPPDLQLDAALALFAGERPGPHPMTDQP